MNKYESCMGCPDRNAECHGSCPGYQARRAECDAAIASKQCTGATSGYVHRSVWEKRSQNARDRKSRRKRA